MIKLQNVIIMRISDFRRFFNLREFWNKRDEFFKQFEFINCEGKSEREYSLFVDNEKEKLLLAQFCNWICEPNKELCSVKMDQQELKIDDSKGGVQSCPLGLLQPYIDNAKKQNRLTNKQIIGLTLLYLLLDADKNCSNIKVEYRIFSANIIRKTKCSPLFKRSDISYKTKRPPKNNFPKYSRGSKKSTGKFCFSQCFFL